MIAKLSKHGDELALVLDRTMLELLNFDESTPLELSIDGRTLVVAPVSDAEARKKFEQAMASINERYAATFKRLAE